MLCVQFTYNTQLNFKFPLTYANMSITIVCSILSYLLVFVVLFCVFFLIFFCLIAGLWLLYCICRIISGVWKTIDIDITTRTPFSCSCYFHVFFYLFIHFLLWMFLNQKCTFRLCYQVRRSKIFQY